MQQIKEVKMQKLKSIFLDLWLLQIVQNSGYNQYQQIRTE